MKALRLTPKVEVEEGSSSSASLEKDELKFQITLEESAIDYWPNISSMTFDKIFNEGIINVEYFGSETSVGLKPKNLSYFTQNRAVIYLGELNFFMVKKLKEKTYEVSGKYFGVNLLKNNSLSEAMNPILLLDFN